MALIDDNTVWKKLDALADCLCVQVAVNELPDLCFCGVIPGDGPVLDYLGADCDDACGMAYVRLVTANPTTGIGIISDTVNNCGAELGFVVEAGIWRCLPVGDESGNPPTPGEYVAAAQLQTADMVTIRQAFACCDLLGEFILDAYTPAGPEGGAVGGAWQATLSETWEVPGG